jgi:FAD/FMN-containing dehydrogenase
VSPATWLIDALKLRCDRVITAVDEPDAFDAHCTDWTKSYGSGSNIDAVVAPNSTAQVSSIVSFCNDNRIGIIPQGGNTGLCGGCVSAPAAGSKRRPQVILSMSRMNLVEALDENAGVAVVQAGVVLEKLNEFAEQNGFIVPLDLGAKGSCQIGGNVATNAGGIRFLRYGSLHENVMGLEVVLPSGEIIDMLRTLHKDNSGYPLKHLFIGSEGTLGVITKVALRLAVKPRSVSVFFCRLHSFRHVASVLRAARSELGEILSAFEFIDANCIDAVRKTNGDLLGRLPSSLVGDGGSLEPDMLRLDSREGDGIKGPVWVLLECSGSDVEADAKRIESFTQKMIENDLIVDATIATNAIQERELW